jgi:hypothetical protein
VSEASEVKFFTMNSREAFLDGELEGVSVDSLGTLRLANRVSRIGEVEEPFVFGAAAHPDGWVLGTGNSGRVLLLDRQGVLTTLLEASDPTIFAVAVAPSGVVYAGSSPGGTIYRIVDGVEEVLFETGETYVWALAVDARGDLWAATGTEGRLYRVSADGTGTIVFDADDTHLRSLEIDSGGQLLLGTGGEGLIMRLADDGSARTLYDSGLVEVVDIEAGEAGNCFAAVIAAQAGFADMSGSQANATGGAGGAGGGSVTVVEQQGAAAPRTNGAPGPRSQVLRFPCSGGVMETLWSFQDETVYDLLWAEGRLWIGTGQEGKLYSLRDSTVVLEKDVDERQIVAVMPDEHGPALATTNSAALYRVLDEAESRGVYTSAALDAGQIAEFGTLHWRGTGAGQSRVRFAFRSGMSSEPDVTWSGWSPMLGGGEVALGAVPPGRYLQFRAELSAASGAPSVSEVTISYRQKNLAPKITKLEILEAGQVLVPANFNPANQVFEPVAPNREGIFTSLAPERERDNQRLKPLWKRGYRTIQWEAEDPNGDLLTHRIDFRPEGDTSDWFRIVDELEDTYFSFDATVLPDGVYRFRVSSSDKAGNGNGAALETVRTTGPITVDHTAPVLGTVDRDGDTVRVEVRDDLNALRRAEYSTDGRQWVSAVPTDGLLDGRRETFSIEIDSGARLVLFRVMDSFFNLTTFDLLAESR